jgi:hypothetical protein
MAMEDKPSVRAVSKVSKEHNNVVVSKPHIFAENDFLVRGVKNGSLTLFVSC